MKKGTPYRAGSAEELRLCVECGTPQPSRLLLLSSRGRVCHVCAEEADARRREAHLRRDASFEAALISAVANIPGIGLLLAHGFMEPVWMDRFFTGCVLALGFALLAFLRARSILREARGLASARIALGLACSALASCVAGIVLFVFH